MLHTLTPRAPEVKGLSGCISGSPRTVTLRHITTTQEEALHFSPVLHHVLLCVCVTGGGRQNLSLWGLPSPAPVPLSVRHPGQFCHPHVRPCDSQIHPDPSSCWMEGPCQALEERPATGSCVSLAGRAGGLNQEDAAHQSCPELGPTVCQHDARGPGSPH